MQFDTHVGLIRSASATQIAVQAGEGASTNVGVTAAGDAVGALGGGLAEGFGTPTVGLSGSFARSAAAYVGAGTVGALADAVIQYAAPTSTGESAATNAANGLTYAGLANAGA